jgi:leucyl aminopeptidase (aminopeptidase T)
MSMLDYLRGAKLLVETCAKITAGEKVLVVADDEAFPVRIGTLLIDVANSLGADGVLMIIKKRPGAATEPPHAVAVAMKSVNVVIYITNRHGMAHTDARKDATAAGVRTYQMIAVPEDYLLRDITSDDIELIKNRTLHLAQKLTAANCARVTNPAGTDITMSVKGRQALALHPLAEVVGGLPDYAEAAIAPVEGTAEGILVIDIGVLGWEYIFKEPLRCFVKAGKVVDVQGGEEDAKRLRNIITSDENASNIAELGIGTSHTIPRIYRGTRRDGAIAGNIHIAVGRNNDIGGQTWSGVHHDGLLNRPTVELDGEVVVRDGELV